MPPMKTCALRHRFALASSFCCRTRWGNYFVTRNCALGGSIRLSAGGSLLVSVEVLSPEVLRGLRSFRFSTSHNAIGARSNSRPRVFSYCLMPSLMNRRINSCLLIAYSGTFRTSQLMASSMVFGWHSRSAGNYRCARRDDHHGGPLGYVSVSKLRRSFINFPSALSLCS